MAIIDLVASRATCIVISTVYNSRRIDQSAEMPKSFQLFPIAKHCEALDCILRHCRGLVYCSSDTPGVTEMCEEVCNKFVVCSLADDNHVQQNLPERLHSQYNTSA